MVVVVVVVGVVVVVVVVVEEEEVVEVEAVLRGQHAQAEAVAEPCTKATRRKLSYRYHHTPPDNCTHPP